MAAASEPVGYQRGVLYVWVKNSTWMQQLIFMRGAMKEEINKKLKQNYVHEIRLTMDRKSVPGDLEASQELRQSLASLIQDGES